MPNMDLVPSVSHDRGEEDMIAKARWFAQFTPEERLRMAIEWSDTMLQLNPGIADVGRAQPVAGRIQVLERPGVRDSQDFDRKLGRDGLGGEEQ